MSEPSRWRQPLGIVTVCLRDGLTCAREHRVTKTRCILQRRFPDRLARVRVFTSLTLYCNARFDCILVEVIDPMSQVRRQSAVLPRPNWGWQDAAACRGEDLLLFFGPDGERQPEREIRERKAKEVCAACPVQIECLNYAVSRPEKYGTWGGLNEEERSAERRRRMRRANAA